MREGLSTTVVIIFKLGVDLQDAATQVRERVAQTRAKLPNEAKEPSVARFDVGAAPVLTYTWSGAGRSLPEIGLARDVIKPALEQVDGVASVEVRWRAVHVDLVAEFEALHLSTLGILAAIQSPEPQRARRSLREGICEISVRPSAS